MAGHGSAGGVASLRSWEVCQDDKVEGVFPIQQYPHSHDQHQTTAAGCEGANSAARYRLEDISYTGQFRMETRVTLIRCSELFRLTTHIRELELSAVADL